MQTAGCVLKNIGGSYKVLFISVHIFYCVKVDNIIFDITHWFYCLENNVNYHNHWSIV